MFAYMQCKWRDVKLHRGSNYGHFLSQKFFSLRVAGLLSTFVFARSFTPDWNKLFPPRLNYEKWQEAFDRIKTHLSVFMFLFRMHKACIEVWNTIFPRVNILNILNTWCCIQTCSAVCVKFYINWIKST